MPSSRRWDVPRLRLESEKPQNCTSMLLMCGTTLILCSLDSASRQHPALRRAQVPGKTFQMCPFSLDLALQS